MLKKLLFVGNQSFSVSPGKMHFLWSDLFTLPSSINVYIRLLLLQCEKTPTNRMVINDLDICFYVPFASSYLKNFGAKIQIDIFKDFTIVIWAWKFIFNNWNECSLFDLCNFLRFWQVNWNTRRTTLSASCVNNFAFSRVGEGIHFCWWPEIQFSWQLLFRLKNLLKKENVPNTKFFQNSSTQSLLWFL